MTRDAGIAALSAVVGALIGASAAAIIVTCASRRVAEADYDDEPDGDEPDESEPLGFFAPESSERTLT